MPPHRPLPGSSTAGPPTPHCVHGRAGRPPAPSAAPPGCGHVGPWSVWWEALSSAHRQAPTVRPCGEKWGESLAAAPRPAGWGWGGRGSPLLVPPASRSPGLVGVVCPGPSWLVPSCSFRMCLTTAVALKACCQPHSVCHLAQGAPPCTPSPNDPHIPPPASPAHLPLALCKILLDLLAHRLVDVLVQGCVPSNPVAGAGGVSGGPPCPTAAME